MGPDPDGVAKLATTLREDIGYAEPVLVWARCSIRISGETWLLGAAGRHSNPTRPAGERSGGTAQLFACL